ncbi:MAG: hypothetical protein SFZ02_12330 [bacterium]|nr:hypothetical protein [bacterium]
MNNRVEVKIAGVDLTSRHGWQPFEGFESTAVGKNPIDFVMSNAERLDFQQVIVLREYVSDEEWQMGNYILIRMTEATWQWMGVTACSRDYDGALGFMRVVVEKFAKDEQNGV